ncbi:hypothetical protein ACFWB1_37895, partial [Streptomyces goshikiensis]
PSAYLTHHEYSHPPTPIRNFATIHPNELKSVSDGGPVAGHGFVRLGGCNAAFANRLAEVIAAGAAALQYQR